MNTANYVPILLTKRGERFALRDLPGSVHELFTPLLVVAPIDWDFEEERPSKTISEHIQRLPSEIHEARGGKPAMVELPFLEDDETMSSGEHPLVWLTAQCETPLIPAVSPNRTAAYRAAVAQVAARDRLGICLRLHIEEWPINAPAELDELLQSLPVDLDECDLVLDLGDETGDLALTVSRQQLRSLPHVHDWRSVVLAGSAMPKEMPQGTGVHELESREWVIYRTLLEGDLPRVPTFGDYAIACPDPTLDVDPKIMSLSATVRYAVEQSWLVPKGQLWKGRGGTGLGAAAVPPVLMSLRAQPAYAADDHCALEVWAQRVASTGEGGGNPEAWRRYGTLHHIQFVTEQLANLRGI
jgi:hypothetical protein